MNTAKVLIVEDEQIIQLDLQDRMEQFGYEVSGLAASGADAIKQAHDSSPDLILMDIRLEGEMDGIEAAVQIRLNQHMPIIYVTALSDIRNLGRAAGTEPYFYLIKPVRPAELKATIENALRREAQSSV
jgi:DNA-binding response OmpR family regulator